MKKIIALGISIFLCIPNVLFAREITNIQATVDKSGEKIIISYELDEMSNIEVYYSDKSISSSFIKIADNLLSGAHGENVGKGKKKVTWKSYQDVGGIMSRHMYFRIVATKSERAENFKNAPMGQLFESFKSMDKNYDPNKKSPERVEATSRPISICALGEFTNVEPTYTFSLIGEEPISPYTQFYVSYKCEQFPKRYYSRPEPQLTIVLPNGEVELLEYSTGSRERILQDGLSTITVSVDDLRKPASKSFKVQTRRNNMPFNVLPENYNRSQMAADGYSETFYRPFKWVKLDKNFDKSTAIYGVRISTSKPIDNNVYFSLNKGVNLSGKNVDECKTEKTGFGYSFMLNTGKKTPDNKYTGIISYLPKHNYYLDINKSYDEHTGIGINMPIILQQKTNQDEYTLWFIEGELYYAGLENETQDIDCIEVYAEDISETNSIRKNIQAKFDKLKQKEADRIQNIRNSVIGRWAYTDRYGSMTLAFWDDGVDFIAYGKKTHGTYRIYNSGRVYLSIGGEHFVVEILSNDKMKIVEGGNGEILHKVSNSPM